MNELDDAIATLRELQSDAGNPVVRCIADFGAAAIDENVNVRTERCARDSQINRLRMRAAVDRLRRIDAATWRFWAETSQADTLAMFDRLLEKAGA